MKKKTMIGFLLLGLCLFVYSIDVVDTNKSTQAESNNTDIKFPLVFSSGRKNISKSLQLTNRWNDNQRKYSIYYFWLSGKWRVSEKRKLASISATTFCASGTLLILASSIMSTTLFAKSDYNARVQKNLLVGGMACGFCGLGITAIESLLYLQAIGNYNLWIMGIPFKVGQWKIGYQKNETSEKDIYMSKFLKLIFFLIIIVVGVFIIVHYMEIGFVELEKGLENKW